MQSTDKIELLSKDLVYLKSHAYLLTRLDHDHIEHQNVRKIYDSIAHRLKTVASSKNIQELNVIAQKFPTTQELIIKKRSRLIPRLIGIASIVGLIFSALLIKTTIGSIILGIIILLSVIDEFRDDFNEDKEAETISRLSETISQAQYFIDRQINN